MQLRILGWECSPGFSPWAQCTHRGPLSEGDRRSERTKRYATEARSGSHWGASRSWVRQETDCPLGLSGGTSPSHPLTSGRSFTSDPHKCEVINWCCCKPLSLWWVTKSVVICIHHRLSGLKQHSLISLGVLLPCGLTDQAFSESSTEQQGSANQPATSRVPFLLGLLLLSQCRALPWKAASSGEFQKSQGPIPPAVTTYCAPVCVHPWVAAHKAHLQVWWLLPMGCAELSTESVWTVHVAFLAHRALSSPLGLSSTFFLTAADTMWCSCFWWPVATDLCLGISKDTLPLHFVGDIVPGFWALAHCSYGGIQSDPQTVPLLPSRPESFTITKYSQTWEYFFFK